MRAWHEERELTMNAIDKSQMKGSLAALQGKLGASKAMSQGAVGAASASVTSQGIPVQVPAIALLSKALDEQNKCLEETLKFLDKLLSKL